MEATGIFTWFERLLAELGFEAWMGDPRRSSKRVRSRSLTADARLLLRLSGKITFPQIWVPGPENRDLRQLLWHRHRPVHALAMRRHQGMPSSDGPQAGDSVVLDVANGCGIAVVEFGPLHGTLVTGHGVK